MRRRVARRSTADSHHRKREVRRRTGRYHQGEEAILGADHRIGDRSEIRDGEPFAEQTLPAKVVEDIKATDCGRTPNAATRDEMIKANLTTIVNSGGRVVLGTDAGIRANYSFGWAITTSC